MATLSIFVMPMTGEFHWPRTALSGAVSLGGLLAAIMAPLIGPALDRHGSRVVLCAAVLVNGIVLVLLSLTPSLAVFYLLFCIARMYWAAPFELGLYGALNNWFVRRRTTASSIATLVQQVGLVALPLIAQMMILRHGWRACWLALGAVTLVVGLIPTWPFLVRRPEDLGSDPMGPQPHRNLPPVSNRPSRPSRVFHADRRWVPRHFGCSSVTRCWSIRCRPGSACIRRPI